MKRSTFIQIFAAICLIGGGVALVGIHFFAWDIRIFAGWWTLFIMAAAIAWMVRHGPRFWNCMLLGGALLTLARAQAFVVETREQYWAAMGALALIMLGVSLLVRRLRPRPRPWTAQRPRGNRNQAHVTVEVNAEPWEDKTDAG